MERCYVCRELDSDCFCVNLLKAIRNPELADGVAVQTAFGAGTIVTFREEDGIYTVALGKWGLSTSPEPSSAADPLSPTHPPSLDLSQRPGRSGSEATTSLSPESREGSQQGPQSAGSTTSSSHEHKGAQGGQQGLSGFQAATLQSSQGSQSPLASQGSSGYRQSHTLAFLQVDQIVLPGQQKLLGDRPSAYVRCHPGQEPRRSSIRSQANTPSRPSSQPSTVEPLWEPKVGDEVKTPYGNGILREIRPGASSPAGIVGRAGDGEGSGGGGTGPRRRSWSEGTFSAIASAVSAGLGDTRDTKDAKDAGETKETITTVSDPQVPLTIAPATRSGAQSSVRSVSSAHRGGYSPQTHLNTASPTSSTSSVSPTPHSLLAPSSPPPLTVPPALAVAEEPLSPVLVEAKPIYLVELHWRLAQGQPARAFLQKSQIMNPKEGGGGAGAVSLVPDAGTVLKSITSLEFGLPEFGLPRMDFKLSGLFGSGGGTNDSPYPLPDNNGDLELEEKAFSELGSAENSDAGKLCVAYCLGAAVQTPLGPARVLAVRRPQDAIYEVALLAWNQPLAPSPASLPLSQSEAHSSAVGAGAGAGVVGSSSSYGYGTSASSARTSASHPASTAQPPAPPLPYLYSSGLKRASRSGRISSLGSLAFDRPSLFQRVNPGQDRDLLRVANQAGLISARGYFHESALQPLQRARVGSFVLTPFGSGLVVAFRPETGIHVIDCFSSAAECQGPRDRPLAPSAASSSMPSLGPSVVALASVSSSVSSSSVSGAPIPRSPSASAKPPASETKNADAQACGRSEESSSVIPTNSSLDLDPPASPSSAPENLADLVSPPRLFGRNITSAQGVTEAGAQAQEFVIVDHNTDAELEQIGSPGPDSDVGRSPDVTDISTPLAPSDAVLHMPPHSSNLGRSPHVAPSLALASPVSSIAFTSASAALSFTVSQGREEDRGRTSPSKASSSRLFVQPDWILRTIIALPGTRVCTSLGIHGTICGLRADGVVELDLDWTLTDGSPAKIITRIP
jgi:hypothetical protein